MVIYFYFDRRGNTDEKSGYRGLLLSLLLQVACNGTGIHQLLQDLYKKYKKGVAEPQTQDLKGTLMAILHSTKICVVVDAMDECNERDDVVSFLLGMPETFQVVVTSRNHAEQPEMWQELQLEQQQVDQDIKKYLECKLKIGKLGSKLNQKVLVTLMDGAQGQWVAPQKSNKYIHLLNFK